jgi:methionine salvage enolase-phosphatase E1
MWHYLSGNLEKKIQVISQTLLDINGWEDQFSITKKVLHSYSSAVDFFNSANLSKGHKSKILKESVDALIVSWHPINELKIRHNELVDVALNGYVIGGVSKPGKIIRTYERILNENYVRPVGRVNLKTELDIMAKKVINKLTVSMGDKGVLKYQNSIASEEAGELCKELSKYYRQKIGNKQESMTDVRMSIIDELYDTLYTMNYVFISAGIKLEELNDYAKIRAEEIYLREIKYRNR